MNPQKVINDSIMVKRNIDQKIVEDREFFTWQLYKIDCISRGQETSVENYVKWKQREYPEWQKSQKWVDNMGRPF